MKAIKLSIVVLIFVITYIPWVLILFSVASNMDKTELSPMLFGISMGFEFFFPFIIAALLSDKFNDWFDSKLKQDEE